jgi:hypothetical protein
VRIDPLSRQARDKQKEHLIESAFSPQVTGHLFSLDFDEAANRGAGAADPGGASLTAGFTFVLHVNISFL